MEENKHNQNPDIFSEKIRQKLENHTMPVDADVWKGIEKRMAATKRIVPVWLYASVAVAAGLALLFSVGNFIYLRDDLIPVSEEIAQHRKEAQQFVVVPEHVKQPVVRQQKNTHSEITQTNGTYSTSNQLSVTENTIVKLAETRDDKEETIEFVAENNTEKQDNPSSENVSSKTSSDVNSDIHKQKQIDQLTLPVEKEKDWTVSVKKKENKSTMLAAALGSGLASSSVSIPGRSRAFRSESLVNLPANVSNVLTPNDFRHKEYLPPFSVGINARKTLTEKLAIESGIAYTYLLTRLSGSTSGDYRAEVKLHYLGLPVNMVWSMLKERKWEIYISAGGMLEKGIRTDFKQYQNWDNVEVNTSANTNVDGVQWSINGTLGVSYDLQKNISLFFDPKLSYYFENDQPFSIRKELPVLLSLNTGLRMTL